MGRRSSAGLQALALAGIVGLFLFGVYSYNDVQGRLKQTLEKAERLEQQQESVSSQLQGIT